MAGRGAGWGSPHLRTGRTCLTEVGRKTGTGTSGLAEEAEACGGRWWAAAEGAAGRTQAAGGGDGSGAGLGVRCERGAR